jgi:hypothetical protein
MGYRSMALILLCVVGCDSKEKSATAASATAPPVLPSASATDQTGEAPPTGCKASGTQPVRLAANIVGFVYGFAMDATGLYYTSWDLYGNRGVVGKARKDGGGAVTLSSLDLEPRGLVVDDQHVYYASGIRLIKLAKQEGEPKIVAPQFSSQWLAVDATNIYGVPGDYGPYDRLIKLDKKSEKTYELAVAERPDAKQPPFGYSAIAVDGSGIYVTDSSGNRVLRFGFERVPFKTLATGQPKPWDLAIDASHVYFSLARERNLMAVPKSGGKVAKLATGLVSDAKVAVDASGIFTTLAGENEQAASKLSKLSRDGNAATIASIPASHSIEALALDDACVYWVQRDSDEKKASVFALPK